MAWQTEYHIIKLNHLTRKKSCYYFQFKTISTTHFTTPFWLFDLMIKHYDLWQIECSHRELLIAITIHLQSTRIVPQTPPLVVIAAIHFPDDSFSQTKILRTFVGGNKSEIAIDEILEEWNIAWGVLVQLASHTCKQWRTMCKGRRWWSKPWMKSNTVIDRSSLQSSDISNPLEAYHKLLLRSLPLRFTSTTTPFPKLKFSKPSLVATEAK